MMGSGSYNGTSSVIAFSSLVLVIYASFVYFRRVKLLRSGDAYGYLDFVGPTILALGVGLGVFIVFADAVKGSEFLPWGSGEESHRYQYDGGRRLVKSSMPEIQAIESILKLQEIDGQCSRHAIEGINLLEYQPRDIIINASEDLVVATPQTLVSHPLQDDSARSEILSTIPDIEIQSVAMIGDRLFALSTGPSQTEVVELSSDESIQSRFLIQDYPSTTGGSIFFLQERLYVYLGGSLHGYQVPSSGDSSLTLTGSINMKVLNRGMLDVEDPITAIESFEGLTYILRERQNTIEAWDLTTATLVSEMSLPSVSSNDKWVGMAFQRKTGAVQGKSSLRKASTESSVFVHMPLDTFPPQLWSFRLGEDSNGLSFPKCEGEAMN